MVEQALTIENNTCIISSNLLDEMDYYIGGYGKPTAEFLFNFNAFVESFILSSSYIITQRELEHINITSPVLFPDGRPILDLISKSSKLSIVSGFGNNITQCVYVDKVEKNDQETALKAINIFRERDAERIKSNFILSDFNKPVKAVKTYSLGFAGKDQPEFGSKSQVMIGETTNQPFEIVKSFFNTITNFNVQAALPVFTYEEQFQELKKKSISKEIYKTICDIQGQSISDAEEYLGSEIQTIPPLVSIILSKAKTHNDLPKILLEIRDDFTEFRECCEKFESNLNNALTVKEQIETIKDYRKFWSVLVKKYADKSNRILFRFLDIAKDSNYEDALDNLIDTKSAEEVLKDLNMGKVAGKAGFALWDKIKEKRILNKFKGVVNLWSLLEDSPTIDKQIKDFERVFGTSIDRNSILTAKKYLSKIKDTAPNSGLAK